MMVLGDVALEKWWTFFKQRVLVFETYLDLQLTDS